MPIIGYSMLVLIFIGIFILAAKIEGLKAALWIFLGTFAIVCWIIFAVRFIKGV